MIKILINGCNGKMGQVVSELAKKDDPDCVTVFVGPCLAKRREGFDDEFVDYVITAEELSAFFEAKGITPAKLEAVEKKEVPTASARNFARTGAHRGQL